jgi:hypothetical protein
VVARGEEGRKESVFSVTPLASYALGTDSKLSPVNVVVAIEATLVRQRRFFDARCVALFAGEPAVQPQQRELRFGVVKHVRRYVLPAGCVVARRASSTVVTLVDIVVTRRTVASRYAGEANERFAVRIFRVFFVDSLMTFCALKSDVPARKSIRRFVVVKADRGFPAVV